MYLCTNSIAIEFAAVFSPSLLCVCGCNFGLQSMAHTALLLLLLQSIQYVFSVSELDFSEKLETANGRSVGGVTERIWAEIISQIPTKKATK